MPFSMRRAAAALAVIGLVLLSACAGGERASPAAGDTVTATPVPEVMVPPAEEAPARPEPPPVAALPPPAPAAPSGAPEDFRRLLGMKGETVRHWMGEVVFVRRDGPAEIWRFAADSCFLDVFLYRESDGLRVAHVDARSRTTGRVTPQACYRRILSSRAAKAAS